MRGLPGGCRRSTGARGTAVATGTLVTLSFLLAAVTMPQSVAWARAEPGRAESGPVNAAEPRGDEPLAPVGSEPEAPPPADATVQRSCPRGHVALTFDDGPGRGTPVVLDALAAQQAPATFFPVGSAARQRPGLIARAVDEGHRVANHTDGHERLTALSDSGIRSTVTRADQALRRAGAAPLKLVRPPYGATSSRVQAVLAGAGYGHVLWSVDTHDWQGPTADQIASRALAGLEPGAVVLLHDGSPYASRSAAALPRIVGMGRQRGYCFGVLDERGRVVPGAPPAQKAAAGVSLEEIAGADRIGTSVAAANAGWSDGGAAEAVVATADRFAEPLVAAGLAGTVGGPLLLSWPTGLDGRVAAELSRLETRRVHLVGPFDADVGHELRDRDIEAIEIAGRDALDTSARTAHAIRERGGDTTAAYVASADDFADALSVSALAAHQQRPVLLTRGAVDRDRLASLTVELGVAELKVVGGTAAVSDEAVTGLTGLTDVERIAGPNRAATALALAQRTDALDWRRGPVIASGWAYSDGLSGGVLAGLWRRPVLLTAGERLSPEVHDWIRDRAVSQAFVLGGRAAIGDGPRCQLRTGLDRPTAC